MSEREMVQSVGLNYSVQAHWWRPKAAANGPGPSKSLRSHFPYPGYPSVAPTLAEGWPLLLPLPPHSL
jgi:hypothetical protein